MTEQYTDQDEWPKEWKYIKIGDGSDINFHDTSMEYQSGIRGYRGTLYVSETIGRETEENSDLWMPFEVYIKKTVKESASD